MDGKSIHTQSQALRVVATSFVVVLLLCVEPSASSRDCVCIQPFASALDFPISLVPTNDGTKRLFVLELSGKVHVFIGGPVTDVKGHFSTDPTGVTPGRSWTGAKLKTLLMDLRDTADASEVPGIYDENGLVGMALHPRFPDDPRIFVSFTISNHSRMYLNVAQVNISSADPNRVDMSTLQTILTVPQHDDTKNGGQLLFRDDFLFIFTGDGGEKTGENAQSRSSLLGKVLRIGVDHGEPFSIPLDNPFVGQKDAQMSIYAMGLRNVFGCGDGPNGELFCADVGEDNWEEINDIKKGHNYGWPYREGLDCRKNYTCDHIVDEEFPVYNYSLSNGQTVVGGTTYRGCRNPSLNGTYIFGDFIAAKLYGLQHSAGRYSHRDLPVCPQELCGEGAAKDLPAVAAIRADDEGEIYVLTVEFGQTGVVPGSGKIFKLMAPNKGEGVAGEEKCRKPQTSPLTINGIVEMSPFYTSGSPKILPAVSRHLAILTVFVFRLF